MGQERAKERSGTPKRENKSTAKRDVRESAQSAVMKKKKKRTHATWRRPEREMGEGGGSELERIQQISKILT